MILTSQKLVLLLFLPSFGLIFCILAWLFPLNLDAFADVSTEPSAPVAAPEPVVDPEHLEKSLETALQATQTQAQELLSLQTAVSSVRAAQTELSNQREALLQRIAAHEAEIAKDRASIKSIDSTLAEHKSKLSELQKTISQKTAKQ